MEPKKTEELLALLTARVQRFHLAPGGIPNLTAEDMAHALGMLKSEPVRLYARVKYCGQTDYADKLAGLVRVYVMQRKLEASWRIPRPDFLRQMAYLMLYESIDPFTCPVCEGRAEVRPESGPVIVCGTCNGTGKHSMRAVDRAHFVGLSKSSWSSPWAERYEESKNETVDRWEAICGAALRKRIA